MPTLSLIPHVCKNCRKYGIPMIGEYCVFCTSTYDTRPMQHQPGKLPYYFTDRTDVRTTRNFDGSIPGDQSK